MANSLGYKSKTSTERLRIQIHLHRLGSIIQLLLAPRFAILRFLCSYSSQLMGAPYSTFTPHPALWSD